MRKANALDNTRTSILFSIVQRSMFNVQRSTFNVQRSTFNVGSGWYFGFCLTYIFTFRFFIEYTKEIQEAFEASLPIDMGQILSIPFIIIGVVCMLRSRRNIEASK